MTPTASNLTPSPSRVRRRHPCLTFSPLAWLKLKYFCHAGSTEVGGFGIAAEEDLLYIEDFATVRQQVSPMTVRFFDDAVADFFDQCVDAGLQPKRFSRVWLHTHPGDSVTPSSTDEETFARVFGNCDWALMFILGRTGNTHARLAFHTEPYGQFLLPVTVDWEAWPNLVETSTALADLAEQWQKEFVDNVQTIPIPSRLGPPQFPDPSFPDERKRGTSSHADNFMAPWFETLEDSYPNEHFNPPF
jgi:proteasome lid subunit RPN8/RPN11